MHTLLPAAAYSPAAHCKAADAAVGHAEPAGQLLQPACEVRSFAELYVPGSHGSATLAPSLQWWPVKHAVHAVAPSASTYVPSEHLVHALAPAAEYVPAEHISSSLAPVGQKEPAAHSTHDAAPAAGE